jgi:hypothetical protein
MPEIDGAAMLRALAREDTLRVFASIQAWGPGRDVAAERGQVLWLWLARTIF